LVFFLTASETAPAHGCIANHHLSSPVLFPEFRIPAGHSRRAFVNDTDCNDDWLCAVAHTHFNEYPWLPEMHPLDGLAWSFLLHR